MKIPDGNHRCPTQENKDLYRVLVFSLIKFKNPSHIQKYVKKKVCRANSFKVSWKISKYMFVFFYRCLRMSRNLLTCLTQDSILGSFWTYILFKSISESPGVSTTKETSEVYSRIWIWQLWVTPQEWVTPTTEFLGAAAAACTGNTLGEAILCCLKAGACAKDHLK